MNRIFQKWRHNHEKGRTACTSKAKKAPPIFRLDITKETIAEFTKTKPELTGNFKYGEDETKIRLDTNSLKMHF